MKFFEFIFQDFQANKGNTKGKIVSFFFRIANYSNSCKPLVRPFFFPYIIFYKILFEWVLGFELPYNTDIGKGLIIYHLQSIVINKRTIIGENFTLRHSTTIGNKVNYGKSPIIGNNVNVGANVCIIGDIQIGDNVIIGAGSIVVKSVPSNSMVAGNPAKKINNK